MSAPQNPQEWEEIKKKCKDLNPQKGFRVFRYGDYRSKIYNSDNGDKKYTIECNRCGSQEYERSL